MERDANAVDMVFGNARAFLVGVVLLAASSARAAWAAKELVVFEAASLRDAFARLGERFEKDHPGFTLVHNAAGSQELRTQLEHGARADVFASADRKHMDALGKQGLVASPSIFICNEPVLVIRPALAGAIRTFADVLRAERIVIGTPEVPVGAYTLQILDKASAKLGADFGKSFQARVASRELNVRQVLAKVVLGEADAGVVYRSDALAAKGRIVTLGIPADLNVIAQYPIAALAAAPRADLARQWIDLVRSPVGTGVLVEAGFTACMKP
jgi:molybdate transport system substrate-binding protein